MAGALIEAEHLHWKKAPTGDNAEMAKQDFCDRLLLKTGFTPEQWDTYHDEMLAFRNKYVVHFDLIERFNAPVPCFEPALKVAYAYQEWVRDLLKAVWRVHPTLSPLYYEQCRAEAFSVINSHIPKG